MADLSNYKPKDVVYHSFNDEIELFEPCSPPRTNTDDSGISNTSSQESNIHSKYYRPRHSESDRPRPSTATTMKRQDSGYESRGTTPRNSISYSRPTTARRVSLSNNSATNLPLPIHNPTSRSRIRPCFRRANTTKSVATPVYLVRPAIHKASTTSVYSPPGSAHANITFTAKNNNPKHTSSTTLTQFPPPDPTSESEEETQVPSRTLTLTPFRSSPGPRFNTTPSPTPPPQTTHYWTSDRTRRLEYAAIDAASRGVKGWIRRHLLPGCIAPKEDKHLAFDDDTGSVRRYRLELEEDEGIRGYGEGVVCAGEKKALVPVTRVAKKKPWAIW